MQNVPAPENRLRPDGRTRLRRAVYVDESYRPIYERLYEARTDPRGFAGIRSLFGHVTGAGPYDPRPIRYAIEQAERERPGRLREDAKALLAVNFEDIVLYPILARGRIPAENVAEDIRQDVDMLVGLAEEFRESPGAQISARAIINALSPAWSSLRVARHGIWE